MQRIRVGFKYFWSGFNPRDNFFVERLRRYYDVEISSSPDLLFYSVFEPGKQLGAPFKMPQIPVGPTRVFYTGEWVPVDMTRCDWALTFDPEETVQDARHCRLPLYCLYWPKNELVRSRTLNIEEILKAKTRFCSFTYSHEVEYRNAFFDRLHAYKRIDALGKCRNNLQIEGISQVFGSWGCLMDWQRQYKFVLSVENQSVAGYTSEKICRAFLSNAIPIYWGNPQIDEEFNPKAFLSRHRHSSLESFIEEIIEVDNDEKRYKAMLAEPWLRENKLNRYMDPDRWDGFLRRIVESSIPPKDGYINANEGSVFSESAPPMN